MYGYAAQTDSARNPKAKMHARTLLYKAFFASCKKV